MTIERPHSTEIEALALARRSGWPEDLRVMLTRYPREQWDAHPNLGAMDALLAVAPRDVPGAVCGD